MRFLFQVVEETGKWAEQLWGLSVLGHYEGRSKTCSQRNKQSFFSGASVIMSQERNNESWNWKLVRVITERREIMWMFPTQKRLNSEHILSGRAGIYIRNKFTLQTYTRWQTYTHPKTHIYNILQYAQDRLPSHPTQ